MTLQRSARRGRRGPTYIGKPTDLFQVELPTQIVGEIGDVAERLRDLRPVMLAVGEDLFDTPEAYESADRLTRDPMPKGGYGPGYLPYQGIVRATRLTTMSITSTRPAHPRLRPQSVQRLARGYVMYGLRGDVPTAGDIASGRGGRR